MLTNYQVMVGVYPTVGSRMPLSIETSAFTLRNPISLAGAILLVTMLAAIVAVIL
ncbi:MAG: hypothetical protein ABIQ99_07005 [Thermoflexales bacterium]